MKANCKKCQKEVKRGVNKDCLFGEYDGEVWKFDPKSPDTDHICPWCEVQCCYNLGSELPLDHFYHFHGKDKGKCYKGVHKTEEEIKRLENSGEKGFKDVRKLYYVEANNSVNNIALYVGCGVVDLFTLFLIIVLARNRRKGKLKH